MKLFGRVAVALMLFCLVGSFVINNKVSAGPNGTWPQWTRSIRARHFARTTNLPSQWSTNVNIKWKASIPGRGHSSPHCLGQSYLSDDCT